MAYSCGYPDTMNKQGGGSSLLHGWFSKKEGGTKVGNFLRRGKAAVKAGVKAGKEAFQGKSSGSGGGGGGAEKEIASIIGGI